MRRLFEVSASKHSEKLRAKNLKSGKKKTKGWGKMVDTGFGGLNNLNPVDTKEFIKEEQKRNGKIKSHY
ncbi:hypothetical protein CDL00_07745 [Enterococcus faecium]|nr:hypothetical protein CDL00_07745 [Enterococcus faecium]